MLIRVSFRNGLKELNGALIEIKQFENGNVRFIIVDKQGYIHFKSLGDVTVTDGTVLSQIKSESKKSERVMDINP